ncbi:MAG TPA: cobalamin-binding protein [Burkholderiales bacterium]|nr:cobalamin-binding protein [Burkholderiales bacterium]
MKVLLFFLAICCNALAAPAVTDDYGNPVTLARPAQRIVSLSPHLTELLYAAGAGAHVVGAVEYSDYPPEARRLPRVGSDFGIDLEHVLALRPDLVVAWPNASSVKAVDRIASLGVPVFRSEPRELDDIPRTLERLGALTGEENAAAKAAADFRGRLRTLQARYQGRASVRVFYQVWDRPIITVNGQHLISKVIRLCGGENVFAGLPVIAPEINRESVLQADPDAIIASGAESDRPAWLDAWKAFPLRAAARGQLYGIPRDLIQRPTPRVLEGAERMCRILDAVRAARS